MDSIVHSCYVRLFHFFKAPVCYVLMRMLQTLDNLKIQTTKILERQENFICDECNKFVWKDHINGRATSAISKKYAYSDMK